MRLWSLHPSYLDTKGLLATWREGLLALHVLRGETKGYKHHPQLLRFKNHAQPIAAISAYLHVIADEADRRQFQFQRTKLENFFVTDVETIFVTSGQVQYEMQHLKQKLAVRDPERLQQYADLSQFEVHSLFTVKEGKREAWERGNSVTHFENPPGLFPF